PARRALPGRARGGHASLGRKRARRGSSGLPRRGSAFDRGRDALSGRLALSSVDDATPPRPNAATQRGDPTPRPNPAARRGDPKRRPGAPPLPSSWSHDGISRRLRNLPQSIEYSMGWGPKRPAHKMSSHDIFVRSAEGGPPRRAGAERAAALGSRPAPP